MKKNFFRNLILKKQIIFFLESEIMSPIFIFFALKDHVIPPASNMWFSKDFLFILTKAYY